MALPKGETSQSKLDGLTGKHTRDVIVSAMIIIIILALAFCNLSEKITDGLIHALLALVGFFAGTKLSK